MLWGRRTLQAIDVATRRFISHRARSLEEHRRRARHGEGPCPLNKELHGLLAVSYWRLRPDAEIVSGGQAQVIAKGEAKGFVPHRMHNSTESLLHEKMRQYSELRSVSLLRVVHYKRRLRKLQQHLTR
jgi:hypothetical protein